jgi:hypothetical protein
MDIARPKIKPVPAKRTTSSTSAAGGGWFARDSNLTSFDRNRMITPVIPEYGSDAPAGLTLPIKGGADIAVLGGRGVILSMPDALNTLVTSSLSDSLPNLFSANAKGTKITAVDKNNASGFTDWQDIDFSPLIDDFSLIIK